jgi:hypothetical protein
LAFTRRTTAALKAASELDFPIGRKTDFDFNAHFRRACFSPLRLPTVPGTHRVGSYCAPTSDEIAPAARRPPAGGGRVRELIEMSWRHSKHIMGRVRQTASVDMKGCRAPLVLRGGASLRCIGTIKMSTIVICHQHDQFRFLNRAKRFFYPCPSDMEQNSSYPQPEYRPVPEPWNSLRALSPTHPSMEAYSRWPSSRLLGQLPPRRKHRSLGSFVPKGWEQVGPQTFDSMTRPVTESIVPESNRFGRR